MAMDWLKSINRGEFKRVALLLVLFGVFGVGLWLPAHNERAALRERITEARHELGMDLSDTDKLPVLHQRVSRLRQTLEGSQRYVPREDELDHLLRDLTSAMQAHHAVEPEVVTRRTRRFSRYSVVPLTLRFRGSFTEAFGVLDRIESMSRLVRIDELSMEPTDEQSADAPLTVTIELSTFFAQGSGGSAGAGRSDEEAET